MKQDCPTGLARCTEGAVEITEGRAACPDCPCSWKRVKVCEHGCVVSDVELVREPGVADSFCKGLQVPATTPAADAGNETCPDEGERFLCRHTQVFACAHGSAIPVARCTNGCADEDETLSNPEIDIAAATALMCRHDPRALDP